MILPRLLAILLCLGSTVSVEALIADERDERLAAAGALYNDGKWAEAARGYQQLVEGGEQSAELYYNLGASYYKGGAEGQAALWFRRSLLLDESQREASLSLAYLERKLGIPGPQGAVRVWVVKHPKLVLLAAGTLLLLAAALFLLSVRALLRGGRLRSQIARVVGGLLLVLLPVLLVRWLCRQAPDPGKTAVVVAEAVSLRSAPFESGSVISPLPPGTALRILDNDIGAWLYLELPSGERGYAPAEQVKQLWPISEAKGSRPAVQRSEIR